MSRKNDKYGAVRNRVQLDFYVDSPKALSKYFMVDTVLPKIVAAFYPDDDRVPIHVDYVHLESHSVFTLELSSRKQKVTA